MLERSPHPARSAPTLSWLGDPHDLFNRLGGLKRLDVVAAMVGIAIMAVLRCALARRLVNARIAKRAVRQIGYTPIAK